MLFKDTFKNNPNKELISRFIFESGHTYVLDIDFKSKYKDVISSFIIQDEDQQIIGKYNSKQELDIISIIESQNLPVRNIEENIRVYLDTTRIPFAVIDSGFDINHNSITHKLFNSPLYLETAHGLRYIKNKDEVSLNIKEKLIIGSLKPIPLSHGTHVASIAMNDLNSVGLVGYAGDVSSPKYLSLLSQQLTKRKIKYANMSWGFKELGFPMTPQSTTYIALKDLIYNTKDTLFVAAAGNSNFDLDNNQFDYPASYSFNNILVVGALNTSDYNWHNSDSISPAVFTTGGSNIGTKSVDIFAPGKKVNGAKLAGGKVRLSGTSMASPLALNSILAFESIYPHLNPLQMKKAILKSASHFKIDLPCLSRGVVNHKRMQFIAKVLKSQNHHNNLEQVILESKNIRSLDLPFEIQKNSLELMSIWKNIDESLLINKP